MRGVLNGLMLALGFWLGALFVIALCKGWIL